VAEETFTPKVVLALIVKKGKFLLIRRKLPAFKVNWAFPGGVTEENEAEGKAVVREAKEEVGIDVKVVKKLLERKHPNTLVRIAYFHCIPASDKKPEIGEKYEIAEVEWVPSGEVLDRFTSDVAPEIQKFILSQG
jgi:ADP-ribose pyrophosphatase YjhB (NUDIX family)